jgi:predicted 3-demethylubiquinone-9 3-methyltransferase (glyoxalase superfamily)
MPRRIAEVSSDDFHSGPLSYLSAGDAPDVERGTGMPKQIPCLWFDGQAEEAAKHYTSIFPNSSVDDMTHYGPNMPPPMKEGDVMTVEFTLDGQPYTGLNGGPQFPFSEAISFQIMCKDQEEADYYWNRLTEGGEESQCGWLKDKFGVSWQVIPTELMSLLSDPDPDRAQRAIQAMLQMRRIDIAEIKRAADSVSG